MNRALNFSPQHLSDEAVAAFADSVLSTASRLRAERHVASCVECRQAVQVQREAALTLRSAAGPATPADLLARLMQLPQTTDLPPSDFTLSPEGHAVFPTFRPRSRATGGDPLGSGFSSSAEYRATPGLGAAERQRAAAQPGRRPSRALLVSAAAIVTAGAASVAVAAMAPTQLAQDAPAPSMPARFAPAAFTTSGSLDAGFATGALTQPIRRT